MRDGSAPADPVDVFKTLCWARGELWRSGDFSEWTEAIDPLQQWAVDHGLVDEIGQDAVQAIMAEAFND